LLISQNILKPFVYLSPIHYVPERKKGIGILLALFIGYIIGILTAPKSGKEMREDIKGTMNKSKEKMSDVVDKAVDKTKN